VLRDLPDGSVDCVIADPPYGARRPSAWRLAEQRFAEVPGNDGVHGEWVAEAVRLLSDGGALYVFTCWSVLGKWSTTLSDTGLRPRSCLVWDKAIHGLADLKTCYAPQHEFVLFAAKGRHELRPPRPKDVIRVPRVSATALQHPYEKPVELIGHLVRASTDQAATVLDPFMGSGTTGVACVQTGRNFIGIEIDGGYFRIAERRIAEAQQQLALPLEAK